MDSSTLELTNYDECLDLNSYRDILGSEATLIGGGEASLNVA